VKEDLKDDKWKWCRSEDYGFIVKFDYEIIEYRLIEVWEGSYSYI